MSPQKIDNPGMLNTSYKKVLGFCGHDFQNIGDDAFILTLISQMRKYDTECDVRITSSYIPTGYDSTLIKPVYKGMINLRGMRRYRKLVNGINLDAAFFWGGSVMHEGCNFDRYKSTFSQLKFLGYKMRTGAIGVSIGPIKSNVQSNKLVSFLSGLDYVSVRDTLSYRFLQEHHIKTVCEHHFDLAALLLDFPNINIQRMRPTEKDCIVGIAPCPSDPLLRQNPNEDENRCVRITAAMKSIHYHRRIICRIFEFSGHPYYGDRQIVNRLANSIRQICKVEIVRYTPDPIKILSLISECNLMLAMRYHSAVFSFMSDVPILLLSYHPKCIGLAEDIGLENDYVMDAYAFNPDSIVKNILNSIGKGPNWKMRREDAVASARCHMNHFLTR